MDFLEYKKIKLGIIEEMALYLVKNKELLKDPDYKCLFDFLKAEYIWFDYSNMPLDSAEISFNISLNARLSHTPAEEIEKHADEVHYFKDLIKRYCLDNSLPLSDSFLLRGKRYRI